MKRGQSLKIYLMDGDATGKWSCVLSGKTTKAFKIPRTYYKSCADITELRGTAVYLLFGEDADTDRPVVYVGETEDAYKRLDEHNKSEEKDYWTEAVVFVSQDNHFNKAHIKYLESRFYEIAHEVDRFTVMNAKPPTKSTLAPEEVDEMEDFIDNAKIITIALGYKVFEKLRVVPEEISESDEKGSELLYIKTKNGIDATGFLSPEGFVVCKGSIIKPSINAKSAPKGAVKRREKLMADGTIVDGEFVRDTLFSSPTAASDLIMGNNTSGPREWKNKQGTSLRDLEI